MCPIPYTLLIYYLYVSSFLYVKKKIQTKNNAAVQTYQVYINWQNIFREIYLAEKLHFSATSVFVLKKVLQEFFSEIIETLTHFMPLASFYTSGKHEKISGFLMFSGGIKGYWHEVG